MALDEDGYPHDEDLEKIEQWKFDEKRSFIEFMEHIKACWWMPDFGWDQTEEKDEFSDAMKQVYRLSTGGWSGNESVIRAMEKNWTFWMVCWVQSRRGGHFIFELPDPDTYFVTQPTPTREEAHGKRT